MPLFFFFFKFRTFVFFKTKSVCFHIFLCKKKKHKKRKKSPNLVPDEIRQCRYLRGTFRIHAYARRVSVFGFCPIFFYEMLVTWKSTGHNELEEANLTAMQRASVGRTVAPLARVDRLFVSSRYPPVHFPDVTLSPPPDVVRFARAFDLRRSTYCCCCCVPDYIRTVLLCMNTYIVKQKQKHIRKKLQTQAASSGGFIPI